MDPRPLIYYLCASYLAENDGRDDRALRARNHFAGGVRASDPRHPGGAQQRAHPPAPLHHPHDARLSITHGDQSPIYLPGPRPLPEVMVVMITNSSPVCHPVRRPLCTPLVNVNGHASTQYISGLLSSLRSASFKPISFSIST